MPLDNMARLINELNDLPIMDGGFIYNNYCLGSGSGRQYFSDENGKKIDTIRLQIEKLYRAAEISDDKYYFYWRVYWSQLINWQIRPQCMGLS